MIAALAILLFIAGAASAQASGNALTPRVLGKIPLPAAESWKDMINAPRKGTLMPPQIELAVPAHLFRATVNAACLAHRESGAECATAHAPGYGQLGASGRMASIPAPRWADLQPQLPAAAANGHAGFHWEAALKQSLLFLGVQHGYALTQAKTRRALKGPFWKDYFRAVAGTSGWADGGRFFTNYISHPMQGAISGYIQVQNDPRGINEEFSRSRRYWTSRLKAMAWTAAYSTQFEIGPISQSSIGNVGLYSSLDGKKRKMAYGDMVVTPTLGTAWLVGEDALDRYLVRWVEGRTDRLLWRGLARVLFNPMRGAANLIRFKTPWYRDR